MHRFHVEIEGKIPIRLGCIEDVAVVDVARAIREHVERGNGFRERIDLRGVARIQLAAVGGKPLELRVVEIGRDDLRSFPEKRFRDRPADALSRRGHKAMFSFQTVSHGVLL